jgi:hypothetical protein
MYLYSLTLALDGDGWSSPRSDRFTPGKGDAVPTLQEAGRDPGLVCTGAENLAPTPSSALRFVPLTVQPVTSRYTDVAVLVHTVVCP